MKLIEHDQLEPPEYEAMNEAGTIAAQTHEYLQNIIETGMTTWDLNRLAGEFIRKKGAEPAFYDFENSSFSITVSINEDLIHTPPDEDKTIEQGDIVSIDLGAKVQGHYSDTAMTTIVGEAESEKHEKLLDRTQSALYAGILKATAGNTLKDIGEAIEEKSEGFGIVTDWAGHFIGRELHLGPEVHNSAQQNDPYQLEKGMYLAIEPVLTLSEDASTLRRASNRSIRSAAGTVGAHFEHTIRVGKDRAEILTARSDEQTTL